MTKCDAAIVGGGVAGLVLAIELAKAGLDIALADAGAPPPPLKSVKPDARTVALMGGSIDIIKSCNIWQYIKAHIAPLRKMAVVDDSRFPAGSDEMVEQMFDATELGRSEFGWNIPLTPLRAALNAEAQKFKNIVFHWNTPFETAQKNWSPKLLIGCDGRESPVRKLAGISAKRHAYGQKAVTCIISHSKPHNDTSVEFHRGGGPFTYVPLQGNQCSIVWVEKDADADALLKLPKPAFIRALSDRTRGRLGKIDLVTNPASWPLEFLRAEKLTAPRIALAAEAAHVISPIGAQGLNLSLRDVKNLADILINAHALGLDIGATTTLDAYEKSRKGDVISRSLVIDLANQAVANDTPALRALRRLTLRALSLPGPWRQLVMKKGLAT